MKRQQRTTNQRRNRTYIEGNAVRRLDAVPQERRRERREDQQKSKPKVTHATRRNRERAMQMDLGYVVFLTIVSIATVFICMSYIKLQSDITGRMKRIAALENSVLDLKTDNDATLKRLESSVDYETIKNIAVNELGMIYPNKDQIIYYDVDVNDYMNQLEDIPKN